MTDSIINRVNVWGKKTKREIYNELIEFKDRRKILTIGIMRMIWTGYWISPDLMKLTQSLPNSHEWILIQMR